MTTKPDDGARDEQLIALLKKISHELDEVSNGEALDPDGVAMCYFEEVRDLIAAREEAAVRSFADGIKTSLNDELVSAKLEGEPEVVRKTALAIAKTFKSIIDNHLSDLHPEPTND